MEDVTVPGYPNLKFTYSFRAMCEMLNDGSGKDAVIRRLEAVLNSLEYQIFNSGIKRARKFAAKAMGIGNVDHATILRWSPYIRTIKRMINSTISVDVVEANHTIKALMEIHTIQLEFVTPTFSAIIDIIPNLSLDDNTLVTKEVFDFYKERISNDMNDYTNLITTHLDNCRSAHFSRNTVSKFIERLAEIIAYHDGSESEIDAAFESDAMKSVARGYLSLTI